MRYIFYVFWILILILGFSFSALNPGKITLNYYFSTQSVYVSLALLISLIAGFLLGFIALIPVIFKSNKMAKKWEQYLKDTEDNHLNILDRD